MAVVLDASVVLTWALREERNARGDELLAACANGYSAVPALFPTEVTNALLMAERRQRISAGDVNAFFERLQRMDIRPYASALADMDEVLSLARSESLTAYDAAYLYLAQRLNLPLATFDQALIRAARHQGVSLA